MNYTMHKIDNSRMQNGCDILARMQSDAHSMMTWPDSRHGFDAHDNEKTRSDISRHACTKAMP